jgi:hypothetical protein
VKFFLKLIFTLAVIAGLMFELGSPLWTRTDAAGAAQDAASAAARDYFNNASLPSAKVAATGAAQVRGASVTNVIVQPDGSIKVWVSEQAPSYVLHHVSALKNWYNVTASASAAPIRA